MDVLTNSTKFTEVEHDVLNSIEYAIWIIAGIAISALVCCVWSFFDRIIRVLACLCKPLTCCCQPYSRLRDGD